MTEQAYNVAKSESKPRKNIQYKDVAAAVSKLDNLQFLSDTVPRTMTYKQVKEKDRENAKKAKEASEATDDTAINGTPTNGDDASASKQRSIAHMMENPHVHANGTNGQIDGAPQSPTGQRISHSMANSPIVHRTVQHQQNGHAHPTGDSDVEMEDQD